MKVYLVLEVGYEYNDETYNRGNYGDSYSDVKLYSTLDKAKEVVKRKLIDLIKYTGHEFKDYGLNNEYSWFIENENKDFDYLDYLCELVKRKVSDEEIWNAWKDYRDSKYCEVKESDFFIIREENVN